MSDSKHQPTPSDPPPSYEDAAGDGARVDGSSTSHEKKSTLSAGRSARGVPKPPFLLDLPVLSSLRTKRVILASASPRRRALLAQMGLPNVEVIPSSFPEDLPKTLTPFDYALRTASGKCTAVYRAEVTNEEKGEPALVLAADTVVVASSGAILEKPRSEAQHRAMLRELRSSGAHSVVTACVAMAPLASARDPGYIIETHTEETRVVFASDITDDVLDAYVRTREGVDKAGGYGIQGMGAILVERIEGNFENVVGLPIRSTLKLIEKVIRKAEDEETLEGELTDEED